MSGTERVSERAAPTDARAATDCTSSGRGNLVQLVYVCVCVCEQQAKREREKPVAGCTACERRAPVAVVSRRRWCSRSRVAGDGRVMPSSCSTPLVSLELRSFSFAPAPFALYLLPCLSLSPLLPLSSRPPAHVMSGLAGKAATAAAAASASERRRRRDDENERLQSPSEKANFFLETTSERVCVCV